MSSAAELRETFLAMRQRGQTPRGAVPLLTLFSKGPRPTPKRPTELVRYLGGESNKARRAALMAELAERDGWSLTFYESTAEPCSVDHTDGRSVHVSSRWNAGDRAELSIGAPRSESDNYSWHHELEKQAIEAGGAKRISVSLGRPVADLLADIDRRLLSPYAAVWASVCAIAEQHDQETREAESVAYRVSEIAQGRKPSRPQSVGNHHAQTRVYFPAGTAEVYPGRNGSEPSVSFERLSVSVEQAEEIARILAAPRLTSDRPN